MAKKITSDAEKKREKKKEINKKNYENNKEKLRIKYQNKKSSKSTDKDFHKIIHEYKKEFKLKSKRLVNDNTSKIKKISRETKYKSSVKSNKVLDKNKEIYIKNVSTKIIGKKSKAHKRLDSEKIINNIFDIRKCILNNIYKIIEKLKITATYLVEKMEHVDDINFDEKISILCGIAKHTSASEPYYTETAYNLIDTVENNQYAPTNNLFLTNEKKLIVKTWDCSEACIKPSEIILNNYLTCLNYICKLTVKESKNFFNNIFYCSNKNNFNKLGHSHVCHINPETFKSLFLPFEVLSCHYPLVRQIKRKIYELKYEVSLLTEVDKALNNNDIEAMSKFEELLEKRKKRIICEDLENNTDIDENEIKKKYIIAISNFYKKSLDTPINTCVSCQKLCFRRNVIKFNIVKVNNSSLKKLRTFLKTIKCNDKYICLYCRDKFLKNEIPPTCMLNNMYMEAVPDVISKLNEFEKIFIQLAKAFQVVTTLGTVMKKNIPRRELVKKVKRRTFHLPLPIEETLKTLCEENESFNNIFSEFYIRVRTVPSVKKNVFENLVDIKKIFEALLWLQHNNPCYKNIRLPLTHEELLQKSFDKYIENINKSLLKKMTNYMMVKI